MSSYPDDRNDDPQPKRLIYEKKEQLQQIRDRFWAEGVEGGLNPQTKRYIATVALQFWDVLYEYRNESILSEGDFPDISPVRDRIGRQTEVVSTSKRLGQSTTLKRVPAVNELDDWYLIELTEKLDDLANKLGFSASATTSRPMYDAGKRDNYPDPVVEGIPKPKRGRGDGDVPGLVYSKLYHDWYQRVACGDPNDYVIAISADPRSTGVSGSGKTTLGGGLAKDWFDYSEGGFDAEVQYTLDAGKLAYDMYNETGELAVLVGDEMQGTPATTGLNSKRSQKSEALDAVNAIAAGRSDRKTVILIVQDLKSLNKDALTFIDAWLLIRDDYDFIATHYGVAPDVFDLGSRQTKTPGIEQITWGALPKDDPDYKVMERKKQAAKEGKREYSEDDGDSDDTPAIPKQRRDQWIRSDWDTGKFTQQELADKYELTQGTVNKIVNNNA